MRLRRFAPSSGGRLGVEEGLTGLAREWRGGRSLRVARCVSRSEMRRKTLSLTKQRADHRAGSSTTPFAAFRSVRVGRTSRCSSSRHMREQRASCLDRRREAAARRKGNTLQSAAPCLIPPCQHWELTIQAVDDFRGLPLRTREVPVAQGSSARRSQEGLHAPAWRRHAVHEDQTVLVKRGGLPTIKVGGYRNNARSWP